MSAPTTGATSTYFYFTINCQDHFTFISTARLPTHRIRVCMTPRCIYFFCHRAIRFLYCYRPAFIFPVFVSEGPENTTRPILHDYLAIEVHGAFI